MAAQLDYIKNGRELEFAVFCIENTAARTGIPAWRIYELLAVQTNILQTYIVPQYEILHTQGKDYIVDEIIEVMKEKGIPV